MSSRTTRGCIYFVTDGDAVKIGFATKLRNRIKGLQTSHHFPLFLLGAIPATRSEETEMHKRLAHLRLKGEWFKLSPEIYRLIDGFETAGELIPGDDLEEWIGNVDRLGA